MCWRGCAGRGAGHYPVIFTILMVITFALTYILAVAEHDVDPWFPYISDTGTKRPESCVFGQLLNVASFFGFIVVYLRFRLVKELNRDADQILRRVNDISLVVGLLSAMGLSIVGNFQENAVIIVHLIGAFLCFGCGVFYCFLNAAISYRMFPLYNGIRICRIRLFMSAVALIAFVASLSTGIVAAMIYHKNHPDSASFIFWVKISKNEPGYVYHACSAAFEWLLAISFISFLLTFSCDFDKLKVSVAVEPLVGHLDESVAPSPPPESSRLLV